MQPRCVSLPAQAAWSQPGGAGRSGEAGPRCHRLTSPAGLTSHASLSSLTSARARALMTRPSCATPPPPLCPSCGDRRDAARSALTSLPSSCHRVLKGPPDTVTRKVTGLFRVQDAWSRACWPLRSWFVCRRECTQPPHPPTPDGP